jgi:hypothetical protein
MEVVHLENYGVMVCKEFQEIRIGRGRRKKCCDVEGSGVIVLISRVFRCVRLWTDYSVGMLEHEEWFGGIGRSVYNERLVAVGGFPFLLSLLVLLSSNQYYNFGNLFELLSCLVLSCLVPIPIFQHLRNTRTLCPCRLSSIPPGTGKTSTIEQPLLNKEKWLKVATLDLVEEYDYHVIDIGAIEVELLLPEAKERIKQKALLDEK